METLEKTVANILANTDTKELPPLIYTKNGNVPIADLEYKHFWEDNLELKVKPKNENGGMSLSIEKDGQIAHIEEYYDKVTGDLVKRSVAIYRFKGLDLASDKGNMR